MPQAHPFIYSRMSPILRALALAHSFDLAGVSRLLFYATSVIQLPIRDRIPQALTHSPPPLARHLSALRSSIVAFRALSTL